MQTRTCSRGPERRALSTTIAAVVVLVIVVIAAVVAYEATRPSGPSATTTPPTSTTSTTSSTSVSTTSSSSAAYTVNVVDNATLGNYLVNGTGFTLYYFALDTVGNATSPPVSKCTTALTCITVWPPFYAPNIVVPPGLNASDFTTFTRPDGTNQTAYMGHPLYYFVSDTKPGQTVGQALNLNGGYWYVATVSGSMP
ncbi:MAG: hypothetical protein JRM86_06660 [Nitrososphaerota archaeon]|nr:hypothetical protein [Nitrososphaerota archaeon]MDG6978245.1 hypothetical protein [Nitrososphaerota archaeon]MDG7006600.1 hypothetical protein [Nitrososphaerota archaeon]MDG7021577.1 hypothetical protein [Nitrososphaerota archaeon]